MSNVSDDNNAEEQFLGLMNGKRFDDALELARGIAEDASRHRDRYTFEVWSKRCQQAAAAAGDPYFQARHGSVDEAAAVDAIGKYSGGSALMGAAFIGNTQLVRSLLKRGATVDIRDRGECTPLIGAADENHADIVRLLVEHGADIRAQDKNGQTALHFTAWQGHTAAAQALLVLGADPLIPDAVGFLPVHLAAGAGQIEMLKLLVPVSGVNVKAVNRLGGTPLMEAAKEGRLEAIQALLDWGADARLRDAEGDTAADYAEQYRHDEAVRFLRGLHHPPVDEDKPLEETPPCLRVSWKTENGQPRLHWEVAGEGAADPTMSSLWNAYQKATSVTSQGRWSLPGAPCTASPGVPLVNRTVEPMAYYDHGLTLYQQIQSPTPPDELVRCAMMFARATIQMDLAAEGLMFSTDDAFASFLDVMGPTTVRVIKPFLLVTHWMSGVGIFGTRLGRWEHVAAVLRFAQELDAELQNVPRIREDVKGFIDIIVQRGFESHLTEEGGAQSALRWATALRSQLETSGSPCLPLCNVERLAMTATRDYKGLEHLTREICDWARANGQQEILEDWEAYAQKAATMARGAV